MRRTQIVFGYHEEDNSSMVAESIYKYETKVTCSLTGLHSCGGLVHEGSNWANVWQPNTTYNHNQSFQKENIYLYLKLDHIGNCTNHQL